MKLTHKGGGRITPRGISSSRSPRNKIPAAIPTFSGVIVSMGYKPASGLAPINRKKAIESEKPEYL